MDVRERHLQDVRGIIPSISVTGVLRRYRANVKTITVHDRHTSQQLFWLNRNARHSAGTMVLGSMSFDSVSPSLDSPNPVSPSPLSP